MNRIIDVISKTVKEVFSFIKYLNEGIEKKNPYVNKEHLRQKYS